ncbi:hypothetical protein D3C72_1186780 [compost metagenome]
MAKHHVDFTEALVEQPFENQYRNKRRYRVGQYQHHAINRFAFQRFPLHHAGQHHTHRHGEDHGHHREHDGPDKDRHERLLDAFVLQHAQEVFPSDGDGIAWAQGLFGPVALGIHRLIEANVRVWAVLSMGLLVGQRIAVLVQRVERGGAGKLAQGTHAQLAAVRK